MLQSFESIPRIKFLDPKSDIVFKKIFCEHEELLIHFLNSILPLSPDNSIVSIQYLSSEQAPTIPEMKRPIVDVKCTDQYKRTFIVEMQFEWNDAFISRMTFNTSKAYVNQLEKGQPYQDLCPVYGIAILSENCKKRSQWGDGWYHRFAFQHQDEPDHRLEDMEIIFLELAKFKPSSHSEKKLALLWIQFLREIKDQTSIPEEFKAVPEIEKACKIANEATYSKEELAGYDRFWDSVMSDNTLMLGAKNEGIEIGRGIGIEIGKVEGEFQAKQAIALSAIQNGLDDALISTLTGLTIKEIQSLR